jgi:hypothetical protein
MPEFLKRVLTKGTYTPEEQAGIENAYQAICSELEIAPDAEALRTTIAIVVIEQIHNGNLDHATLVSSVRARLAGH